MSRIEAADLPAMNSSSVMQVLKTTAEEVLTLSSKLDAFINASTNRLKGGGYDAVRARMSLYQDASQKLSTLCTTLYSNVISANSVMSAYVGGYSYLDDSELPQAREELSSAKSLLAYYESSTSYTDEKTGQIVYTRNGTDAQIASQKEVITKLEKLIEKLEHLAETDASCIGMLSGTQSDISGLSNACNSISPSTFISSI